MDNREYHLHEGDELVIKPGEVHWAEGHETWVECYSTPGWVATDHFLVET